jgi:hypothetical protein
MTEDLTEFAVVRFGEGWRIVAKEGAWGRFLELAEAEAAAFRLAADVEASGEAVHVLVQQPYGELLPARQR